MLLIREYFKSQILSPKKSLAFFIPLFVTFTGLGYTYSFPVHITTTFFTINIMELIPFITMQRAKFHTILYDHTLIKHNY